MSAFEELGVCSELIRAVQEMNWLLPTPVQQDAIPQMLGGGDCMVAAETGSGKTGAFCLPILQSVYEELREPMKDAKSKQGIGHVGLNSQDAESGLAFNKEGNRCGNNSKAWRGCRANIGLVGSGKFYYEAVVIEGFARIGWSTIAAMLNLGTDPQGFGYGCTGKKSFNKQFEDYGEPFGPSDIIGCLLDLDSRMMTWSKNGKWFPPAYRIPGNLQTSALFPACCVSGRPTAQIVFNFGEAPFRHQPPPGILPVCKASIGQTNKQYENEAAKNLAMGGDTDGAPFGIILEPTHDLARQVSQELEKFSKYLQEPPIRHALVVGGGNFGRMINDMQKAHIVVGTIGAIVGLVKSNKLHLRNCRFFVLDEADRMCDSKQGNMKDILALYSRLPHQKARVQVCLYSATLHSDEIKECAKQITQDATWVDLKGKDHVPDTVHHSVIIVDPTMDWQWREAFQIKDQRTKKNRVVRIQTDGMHQRDTIDQSGKSMDMNTISEAIKNLKPRVVKQVIDAFDIDQAIIFCRTRNDCINMEQFLTFCGGGRGFQGKTEKGVENPYSCTVLSGGHDARAREAALTHFKDGDCRFLICTDVAARGIDIPNLPFVINVTMPGGLADPLPPTPRTKFAILQHEDYIHRVGRVGRADMPGLAISIVAGHQEKVWFHWNKSRQKQFPRHMPLCCGDTRLVSQGGCAMWYNELAILAKVEQRLKQKIPRLDKKLLQAAQESGRARDLMKKRVQQLIAQVALKDPLVAAARKEVDRLKSRVEELNDMQIKSQDYFLLLPKRWEDCFKKGVLPKQFTMEDLNRDGPQALDTRKKIKPKAIKNKAHNAIVGRAAVQKMEKEKVDAKVAAQELKKEGKPAMPKPVAAKKGGGRW